MKPTQTPYIPTMRMIPAVGMAGTHNRSRTDAPQPKLIGHAMTSHHPGDEG